LTTHLQKTLITIVGAIKMGGDFCSIGMRIAIGMPITQESFLTLPAVKRTGILGSTTGLKNLKEV